MPFEFSAQAIIDFVKVNQGYAPLVIFLMAMGETIVIVSLFIPSSFLLFAIGGLLAASGVPLMPSLIAGGLGGAIGFSMMYLLTVTFQEKLLNAWPFNKYPDTIAKARVFFEKWGVIGVCFGHFTGPIRVTVPIAAGIIKMPPVPFMIANIVGSAGWIIVFFAPGYLIVASPWFRETFKHLSDILPGI
jgi:membrane protein DedA with SNARE-associated domain